MTRKKLRGEALAQAIREARKDPEYREAVRDFIKVTTGIYNLHDYGLDK